MSSDRKCQALYPKLDISDRDSIQDFATSTTQHGNVSTLINNAGVNLDRQYGYENTKKTLNVNYRGTLEVRCRDFKELQSWFCVAAFKLIYDTDVQSHYAAAVG